MSDRYRLINPTWESTGKDTPKLQIGNIYTVVKYHDNRKFVNLLEGYLYGDDEGWWYNLRDFKKVLSDLNNNIKVL